MSLREFGPKAAQDRQRAAMLLYASDVGTSAGETCEVGRKRGNILELQGDPLSFRAPKQLGGMHSTPSSGVLGDSLNGRPSSALHQ